MPAKLVPWVVMMPEKWLGPGHCFFCRLEYKGPKNCAEIKCPLANAKKAVEVKTGFDVCWGEKQAYDFHSRKPVTLWATELEENK